MPPKAKKKRIVAKFSDETAPDETVEGSVEASAQPDTRPSVRQVVEVVEDEAKAAEALETIKEDAREIEHAVESIEEEVAEGNPETPITEDSADDSRQSSETPKDVVGSLFTKQPSDLAPEITVVGKRDTSLGVWVGAMLGIALAVGVSLVVLIRGPQTFTSILPAKPTPTPVVTIAPTPEVVALERKDIQIKVINGGGVPGAGGKMKSFLEEKGYTVVEVGNAQEYTSESTDIVVKSGKNQIRTMLTEDLKADYLLGTTSASLSADASYDAEVIVGKE